jgi:membrane protein DedA with SNARE-associated domain
MEDLFHQIPSVLCQAADAAGTAASTDGGGILDWLRTHGPQWVEQYGAWFIFVAFIVCGIGLHISEDFLLIPAGALIFHGHMNWPETLAAAYFGLILGDTGWIWVCRNFGTRLVHSKRFKRMMHPRRLLEAKHAMEERGAIVLILARFIPGTRTPVLTMTGILHMAWWKFLAVEFVTVAITAPVQIGIGYIGAKGYERAKDQGNMLTWGLAGVALLVAGFFAYRWWQQAKARKGPRPRAPVAWLRTFGRNPRSGPSGGPSSGQAAHAAAPRG